MGRHPPRISRSAAAKCLAIGTLVACISPSSATTWTCEGHHDYLDLNVSQYAKCNNGYLLQKTGYYSQETEECKGIFFEETHCECFTFYYGCTCELRWFKDCTGSDSYTLCYFVQNYIFAALFFIAGYYSLIQMGHMLEAKDRLGLSASELHNDTQIRSTLFSASSTFVVHIGHSIQRLFADVATLCLGSDAAEDACASCWPTANEQYHWKKMALKATVLGNATFFCLMMGIWCLNPYDLIFNTQDAMWAFFLVGIPHLVWAYEAILLQWLHVQATATSGLLGPPSAEANYRATCWRVARACLKAVILALALVSTAFEVELHLCAGVEPWCLEGNDSEVAEKLTRERCTCATKYLFPSFTRTTWPFAFYAVVIAAHVFVYMVLFIRAGLRLRSELRASSTEGPSSRTLSTGSTGSTGSSSLNRLSRSSSSPAPGSPGSGVSKEAAGVQRFYLYLTAVFVAVSIVFAAYSFYPEVTMRSNFSFWILWKTALLVMLYFMFKCIRTPPSTWAQLVATLFFCGDRTRGQAEQTFELMRSSTADTIGRISEAFQLDRDTRKSRGRSSSGDPRDVNAKPIEQATPGVKNPVFDNQRFRRLSSSPDSATSRALDPEFPSNAPPQSGDADTGASALKVQLDEAASVEDGEGASASQEVRSE